MTGYFMNMLIHVPVKPAAPCCCTARRRCPSRKASAPSSAERAVDMIMLLGIAGLTVVLQLDKLDLFQARIAAFRAEQGDPTGTPTGWPWWLIAGVVIAGLAAITGAICSGPRQHCVPV